MWDFSLGRTFSILMKTMPFVVFRLVVYLGIAIAYVVAVGTGAGIGYGLTAFGDEPGRGAGLGGMIGFGIVSGVLYWLREYVLYLVKAGHIAVMVELLDNKTVPAGRGQIVHAQAVVKERFAETSILFGIDQLIKGILRAVNSTLLTVTSFLPIPALDTLARFVNAILNLSLTFVDEVILARNIRSKSDNPWESSKDGLILYAQNYKVMLKNAVVLMVLMYALAVAIFLVMLVPAGAIVAFFPGSTGGWTFVTAIVLAWSLKAALLEPFAVAAMMQVYFKAIHSQEPSPEWDAKLSGMSRKFRTLKDKAGKSLFGERELADSRAA